MAMERPGDLMTIKAFAEAAGRSQQAIYKQVQTRLASYIHEKDGQKFIERRALSEVFKIGENQPIQPDDPVRSSNENNVDQRLYSTMQATIELLQEQVKIKDQQLETKDKQIAAQLDQLAQLTAALESTTQSLQAAQALHAGTMQAQLGAGDQTMGSAIDAEEEILPVPESKESVRKWWQFWK